MRGSRRRRALGSALLLVVPMSASALARADEKSACIAASDEGQQLKIDGKLTLARKRLLTCARAECPAIVRQDCAQWMAEVDAALPTVVLGARDAEGRDLIAVRVLEDGAPVVDHLDGRPFPVDPGPHVFRFEAAGATAVEVRVLARAGEQNRAITAAFGPAPRPPPSAPLEATPPVAAAETRTGPSPLAWAFGGVAVAALATALYFEVAQVSDYDHLSSTCAGHCPPDQVDHVGTERWVAGVSAGLGVVSLGAAAYFVLSRSRPAPKAPPVALGFESLPSGGIATFAARF